MKDSLFFPYISEKGMVFTMKKILVFIFCFILLFLSCENQKNYGPQDDPNDKDTSPNIESNNPKTDDEEQIYPTATKPEDLIEVNGLLYFIRWTATGETFEEYQFYHTIYSIKEDGTDEQSVYTFESESTNSRLMKINSNKILFFIGYDTEYRDNVNPAILDLNTKEVKISEDSNIGMIKCYGESIFYVHYEYEPVVINTYFIKSDFNFNATLLDVSAERFSFYKNQILYDTGYNVYYSCDLNGNNMKPFAPNTVDIHNDIAYRHEGDKIVSTNVSTGESVVKKLPIIVSENLYFDSYIISKIDTEKEIYKISYDLENVEIIAQYYCDIQAIGEYIYLTPSFGDLLDVLYEDEREEYDRYALCGAIYRMRHDGSEFEKFVEL